jgi:NAD(P)-dependent dehydrogenase (short-subunit alcohol dehydrogenase family)
MMQRFANKVALISGATSGIGRVTAQRMLDEGGTVVFCGFDDAVATAMVAASHGRAHYVNVDLVDAHAPSQFVDAAIAAVGRIDIIINNAASVARSTLETTDALFFDRMMAINVRAPMLIIRQALPYLRANPRGAVVLNIGSLNAYVGAPNLLAYATSKGALVTMSRNLAAAHRAEGIRVQVLNVGWTHSDGEHQLQVRLGNGEDWAVRAGQTRPTGKLLDPHDIASAILFFASDDAAPFSGAVIDLEQMPIR